MYVNFRAQIIGELLCFLRRNGTMQCYILVKHGKVKHGKVKCSMLKHTALASHEIDG
ncbi:MAG: hypothetical protein ACJAVV_003901 [Alphaproteobacteria bacterium]|jgi:hypothetical protein